MKLLVFFIYATLTFIKGYGQTDPDAILGKWIIDKGNCIVEIYKQQNDYKGKVIWFDVRNKKPIEEWRDEKNPNPCMRNNKLLGMEVVEHLHYDPSSRQWIDGIIYDATSGKKWDSVVWLTKSDQLKVKGYWVFKFLSQTKTFKRIK